MFIFRGSEVLPKPRHPGIGCGLPFLLCQVPCPAFLGKVRFGWQSLLPAVPLLSPDYSSETLADCLDDIYCLCSCCVLHLKVPAATRAPHTPSVLRLFCIFTGTWGAQGTGWLTLTYLPCWVNTVLFHSLKNRRILFVRLGCEVQVPCPPHTHTLQGTQHHTVGLGENRPSISHVAKMH